MTEQEAYQVSANLVPVVDTEIPSSLSEVQFDRMQLSALVGQVIFTLSAHHTSAAVADVDTEAIRELTQEVARIAIDRVKDANAKIAEWRERQEQYAHRQENGMHPVVSGDLEFYGIPNVQVVGIPEQIVQEGCSLYDLMDAGWVFTFGELRSFGLTDDHADRIARSIAMDSPHELAKPLMSGGALIGKISPESRYSAGQKAAFRKSGKPNSVPAQEEV